MGYRSDVRITTTKNGFEKITDYVNKHYPEDRGYNLLNNLDVDETSLSENIRYFGWNFLKWYDGYVEVDVIMNSLKHLADEDLTYRFIRMGEDYDDVEELSHDGKDELDEYVPFPSISRCIDDDYITSELECEDEISNTNSEELAA